MEWGGVSILSRTGISAICPLGPRKSLGQAELGLGRHMREMGINQKCSSPMLSSQATCHGSGPGSLGCVQPKPKEEGPEGRCDVSEAVSPPPKPPAGMQLVVHP